jgi:hypothetical protein
MDALAHLDLSKGALSATVLGQFLKEIADLGLIIVISELDGTRVHPAGRAAG